MVKTVLIVDDSAFMRKLLREIIEKEGHEVIGEAGDGKGALSLYKKLKPDIVTMDIIMPHNSGVEIVEKIKKMDKDAKIVMISALGQQSIVMDAINAGAREFITKPFKTENVIEIINRME